MAHVNVKRPLQRICLPVVEETSKINARDNLAGRPHQNLENFKFDGSYLDAHTIPENLARARIQAYSVCLEQLRLQSRASSHATEHSLYARKQLIGAEWL